MSTAVRPGAVVQVVRDFRRDLLSSNATALTQLGQDYARIRSMMDQEAARVRDLIDRAQRQGRPVRSSWLHQELRLDELQAQLRREVNTFGEVARQVVNGAAHQAAALGQRAAGASVAVAAGGMSAEVVAATLPTEALKALQAVSRPDAPVGGVLRSMGDQAAEQLRDALQRGVALGEHPLKVAARMRKVADVPLARARTVARTEALRAYRSANVATFAAIPEVSGWVWIAGADRNTCGACWAMHGTEHPDGTELESHPNCRCVPAPKVPGQRRLVKPGADQLKAMDATELARIVGPAKAALLKVGRIQPADLVGTRTSPLWGLTRSEASIGQALANAKARRAGARGLPRKPAAPTPPPRPVPPPPDPLPAAPSLPPLEAAAVELDRLRKELEVAAERHRRLVDEAVDAMEVGDKAWVKTAYAAAREASAARDELQAKVAAAERAYRELQRAQGPPRYMATDEDRKRLEQARVLLMTLRDDLADALERRTAGLREYTTPDWKLQALREKVALAEGRLAQQERRVAMLDEVVSGAEVRGIDRRMVEVTNEVAAAPSLGMAEDALRQAGLRVTADSRLGPRPVQVRRERLAARTGADVNPARFPDHVPIRLNDLHAEDQVSEAFNLLHELGHWLDYDPRANQWRVEQALVGKDDVLPGAAELREVLRVASDTDVIRRYKRTLEVEAAGGGGANIKDQADFARYALQPLEVWARAFSQWVAVRARDNTMARMAAQRSSQWDLVAFRPIAEAIDRYLEAAGWL